MTPSLAWQLLGLAAALIATWYASLEFVMWLAGKLWRRRRPVLGVA